MAQTIKIKRSTSTATPTSLSAGELAYSSNSDKLFIGHPDGSTGTIAIGGTYYTDIIDSATKAADKNISSTTQTVSGNAVSATSGRSYLVQKDGSDNLIVNVPWVDTNTTYTVGDGGLTQNNFTDADHNKLDGIETGATADQTDAEIKTAYENNADTNAFTDADHSKLDGIEALADVTDTINVVAALTAGTNVTIASDGTISSTDTNDDVSTANLNTALASLTNTTIGDSSGTITIDGNLTVSGTTTTVNSNTVNIGDNILILNSDETGTPSQDGGIEVERGTSTNVSFFWDESAGYWAINDASTTSKVLTAGNFETSFTGTLDGGTF